jgi:hypothetical protein
LLLLLVFIRQILLVLFPLTLLLFLPLLLLLLTFIPRMLLVLFPLMLLLPRPPSLLLHPLVPDSQCCPPGAAQLIMQVQEVMGIQMAP